jgi:hypothetical protein
LEERLKEIYAAMPGIEEELKPYSYSDRGACGCMQVEEVEWNSLMKVGKKW